VKGIILMDRILFLCFKILGHFSKLCARYECHVSQGQVTLGDRGPQWDRDRDYGQFSIEKAGMRARTLKEDGKGVHKRPCVRAQFGVHLRGIGKMAQLKNS
jgi:hypothetical protein